MPFVPLCLRIHSFIFFFIQFNVPFKIISAHHETGKSVGVAKTGESRENPPDTLASRT